MFNLETNPNELNNLATTPEHQAVVAQLSAEVDSRWDLDAFDAAVRQSQACRWVVYEALRQGGYYPWDYQALQQASERFMRNHMDLNQLEEAKRYPRGD